MSDSNIILQGVARILGKCLRKCENYDANVCKFKVSSETGWKPVALSGYPFSEELSYECRTHKVHLRANPEYLLCTVSGRIDVGVCSISKPNEISSMRPTRLSVAGDSRWPVFVSRSAGVPEGLRRFLDHPDLHKAVGLLLQRESESLHIFQGSLDLYSKPHQAEEVLDTIDVLVRLMDLFASQIDGIELSRLPPKLQCLAPLLQRWSVSDDSERDALLDKSTRPDLEALVSAVEPYLGAIDQYLDSFKGKRISSVATALGTLAECALEARLKLDQ
jgi:hypothetical protein